MNKNLIKNRFSKAALSYENAAFKQKLMAEELIKLISLKECVDKVYEIGCGTGFLSELLLKRFDIKTFYINDISSLMLSFCKDKLVPLKGKTSEIVFIEGDASCLSLQQSCDLIVSNAVFQWFVDFKSALLHIKTNLKPGGTLCFSTFLSGTCAELVSLGHPGINYLTEQELLSLLKECGFEIDIFKVQKENLVFEDSHKLLKFFKETGTNCLASYHWTQGKLKKFMQEYEAKFKVSNGVSLSWIPCYVKARLRN